MRKFMALALLALLFLVIGCSSTGDTSKLLTGGSVTDASLNRDASGNMMYFKIPSQGNGEFFGVDFRGTVQKGTLRAKVLNPDGRLIWSQAAPPGPFTFDATVNLTDSGTYQLGVEWDGPVQAQYGLVWSPNAVAVPTVSPLALLSGLGMLLVSLGFIIYALWRRLGWKYLLLGMLAWVVTVALKFAWAIPINGPVYDLLSSLPVKELVLPIFAVYIGALTGVFEVAVTYLVLRYTRLGRATWSRAFAFGIGFGTIEALLLGLSSASIAFVALSSPNVLPATTLQSIAAANNPLLGVAPVVERFFTVWLHICSNVLIFYAIARKQPRWFWLAFVYKTTTDSIAGYAQVSGMLTVSGTALLVNIWIIEAFVVLLGLLGWWGTRWIERHYPQPETSTSVLEGMAVAHAE